MDARHAIVDGAVRAVTAASGNAVAALIAIVRDTSLSKCASFSGHQRTDKEREHEYRYSSAGLGDLKPGQLKQVLDTITPMSFDHGTPVDNYAASPTIAEVLTGSSSNSYHALQCHERHTDRNG